MCRLASIIRELCRPRCRQCNGVFERSEEIQENPGRVKTLNCSSIFISKSLRPLKCMSYVRFRLTNSCKDEKERVKRFR